MFFTYAEGFNKLGRWAYAISAGARSPLEEVETTFSHVESPGVPHEVSIGMSLLATLCAEQMTASCWAGAIAQCSLRKVGLLSVTNTLIFSSAFSCQQFGLWINKQPCEGTQSIMLVVVVLTVTVD